MALVWGRIHDASVILHERRAARDSGVLRLMSVILLLFAGLWLTLLLPQLLDRPPLLVWLFLLVPLCLASISLLMWQRTFELLLSQKDLAVRRAWRWRRIALADVVSVHASPANMAMPSMQVLWWQFDDSGSRRNLSDQLSWYKAVRVTIRTREGRRFHFKSIEPRVLLPALERLLPTSAERNGKAWSQHRESIQDAIA